MVPNYSVLLWRCNKSIIQNIKQRIKDHSLTHPVKFMLRKYPSFNLSSFTYVCRKGLLTCQPEYTQSNLLRTWATKYPPALFTTFYSGGALPPKNRIHITPERSLRQLGQYLELV